MADETDPSGSAGIIRRQITPTAGTAEYDFLEIVAELEGSEMEELPTLYDEVDHLIETMFRTPPSSEAQVEIEFSYAGYRVRMDDQGVVELISVKESIPDGT